MNRSFILIASTAFAIILIFSLGFVIVYANSSNIVPVNDETQFCREKCGLGTGKPTGDFFGFDSANECMLNCFAAKGIGNINGTCNPNSLDGCCNVFASQCQDPDCFTAEVCDLKDNDCDGSTDEGLGSTTCGVGECGRTVQNCVSGVTQTCTPRNPTTEVCDGLDNDCDGATDEVCISLGACFTSLEQFSPCFGIGGKDVFDATCPTFTEKVLGECIEEFFFTERDCRDFGGIVEPTDRCSSGKGCIENATFALRCPEDRCPHFFDNVTYLSVNSSTGDATFRNLRDNRQYSCILLGSQPSFNCISQPKAGDVVGVISLGISSDDPACHTHFNLGTDNLPNIGSNECTYRCFQV